MHIEDFSLICPQNDLESATILDIAGEYPIIDTRTSPQDWGGKLGKEPPENLHNLRECVVIVELPDEAAEERLRKALPERFRGFRVVLHQIGSVRAEDRSEKTDLYHRAARDIETAGAKRAGFPDVLPPPRHPGGRGPRWGKRRSRIRGDRERPD